MTTYGRTLCLYMARQYVFTGPLRIQTADIEKFLNHRLTLKPEDRYTVVKPDEVKIDR